MERDQMRFPAGFADKVLRVFGENGRAWLPELPNILEQCRRKWGLYESFPCPTMSMNYIEFATTAKGEAVALKVGVPHRELFTEMEALELFNGRGMARVLAVDRELGAILMQRVQPRLMLWQVGDNAQETKAAAAVMSGLSMPAPSAHSLPLFSQWVERAFRLTRTEWDPQELMPRDLIYRAEEAFLEIEASKQADIVLHGDLHHENILLDDQAGWIAIDPKGVIGAPCLETGRFLQNQLDRYRPEQREAVLRERVNIFSVELGYSPEMVAACGLVDCVLSHCWCFEDTCIGDDWYQGIEIAKDLYRIYKPDRAMHL